MRQTDRKPGDPARASGQADPYAPAREASGDPAEIVAEAEAAPQRNFVVPLAIALAVFVVVIAARMLWTAWTGAG